METGVLQVYQCKVCKRIVSDSSFLVFEYEAHLIVTVATTTFGPEQEIALLGKLSSKINPALCHCETVIGIYCNAAPPDEQQFSNKYILDSNKLLRWSFGRGFTEPLNKKLTKLSDQLLDVVNTFNVSRKYIESVKVTLHHVVTDPELLNKLEFDYNCTNVLSNKDM